jgi:hypothetical protein
VLLDVTLVIMTWALPCPVLIYINKAHLRTDNPTSLPHSGSYLVPACPETGSKLLPPQQCARIRYPRNQTLFASEPLVCPHTGAPRLACALCETQPSIHQQKKTSASVASQASSHCRIFRASSSSHWMNLARPPARSAARLPARPYHH